MNRTLIGQSAGILGRARRVVTLTGAGVSAESGVSTFRDPQSGFWSKYDPERLASVSGFREDPGLVWRWYMERLYESTVAAKPNPGHSALAQLEQLVTKFTLITQNVDNLHEQAGSKNVVHLHGNINSFFCILCDRDHVLQEADRTSEMPPTCIHCGGLVRPGVVWFGEQLPSHAVNTAWDVAQRCDAMLVIGTSGIVYPAAHLPHLARENGAVVVDVNTELTEISRMADLFLQGPSGVVLPQLVKAISSE